MSGPEDTVEAETGDDPDRLLHTMQNALVSVFFSLPHQPNLTLRQLAVLLVVYLNDERQTVRGLAGRLNVPKYVVFRAIDRLVEMGLARQVTDIRSRRGVTVCRTVEGAALVRRLKAI